MKPGRLKGFGLRLFISLLIVGGAYFAIQQRPDGPTVTSPEQSLIQLRSNLQELYLRTSNLIAVDGTEEVTSQTLARLITELENSANSLTKQIPATSLLTPAQKQSIDTILANHKQALKLYQTGDKVLGQVIAYTPERDLGGLDISQSSALLATRALAAQSGMERAAVNPSTSADSGLLVGNQDGPQNIVNETTRVALQTQAACFERLAQAAQSGAATTASIRQQCIAAYPAVRSQAVDNILQQSFSSSYLKQLEQQVEALLKQFEATLNKDSD